jgi:hypothetical protein
MPYDEALANDVIEKVKAIATLPFVKNVEDHYAIYFDELGLTVNIEDAASENEWEPLAEQLITYLNNVLPKGNHQFCWVLSFYRSIEQVGLFFPGESLGDNYAKPYA